MACGCGAAETRATPPFVPRSEAPREVEAEVSPPVCRIEAVRAEGVVVAPPEMDPFTAHVSDGALALVPTDDDRHVVVHVEHPLRFSGEARTDEQRLVVARTTDLAAGSVRVAAGVAVSGIARDDTGLLATLQIGRAPPEVVPALDLAVGPVPLACDDVIAEADPEPRLSSALMRQVPGGEVRVAATLPLVVRPLRLAPARVEVRPYEREGFVPVWTIGRQGDDVRVAIAFSDGTRIEGWVPLTALREPSAAEAEAIERLTSLSTEPMALGMLGVLEGTQPGAQADEYVGLASLRPGSAVYAEPGRTRWAESAEQPLEVRVRWQRGARHAQLLEVPGVWVPPERAWVHRGDLSLPEP